MKCEKPLSCVAIMQQVLCMCSARLLWKRAAKNIFAPLHFWAGCIPSPCSPPR